MCTFAGPNGQQPRPPGLGDWEWGEAPGTQNPEPALALRLRPLAWGSGFTTSGAPAGRWVQMDLWHRPWALLTDLGA